MIRVKQGWWKDFFDKTYLITDRRTVDNPKVTMLEVDLIERLLRPRRESRIIDFCGGQGRHAIELARRGYGDLTVIDFSRFLIAQGKKAARKKGVPVRFYHRDARSTGFPAKAFNCAVLMANSFGYFVEKKNDRRLLKEVYRVLAPGGRLLLDIADAQYIRRNLAPRSWHEADEDVIVCRVRDIGPDCVKAREVAISKKKGLLKDKTYCTRLYGKDEIRGLLKRCGFSRVTIKRHGGLRIQKGDYGFLSARLFILAQKQR
ncbi:MAG: class I SAM-dependent methyltransferase [Candidatus Omnitrophica bacterium]|nr:class I SAM-dependent methyltransferase [Candidatus Omnitrophota bacterium]